MGENPESGPDEQRLEEEVQERREGAPGYDLAEEEAYADAQEDDRTDDQQ